MVSPFLLLLLVVVSAIAVYLTVPDLIRGLQHQCPFEYEALGSPEAAEVLARTPSRVQLAFIWFALSGRAYAATQGSVRVLALIYQAANLVSIVCMLILLFMPRH